MHFHHIAAIKPKAVIPLSDIAGALYKLSTPLVLRSKYDSIPLRDFFADIPVTCYADELLFTYFLFPCLNSCFFFSLLPEMNLWFFYAVVIFSEPNLISHLKSPYFWFYGIAASLGDAKKSSLYISSDR